MRFLLSTALVAVLAFPLAAYASDPNSYSEPDRVRVTHLDLDLKLDFAKNEIGGKAVLDLDWRDAGASALVLDTSDLTIKEVESVNADGRLVSLPYSLAPAEKVLGAKLTIQAPAHPTKIRILYVTSPAASGLQWLNPAQTADKKLPLVYSESESVHARSWIPLQDTPSVRFTYTAHVTVPRNIRVVMSAPNDAKHPLDGDFRFSQPRPIPSYLVDIAAGSIAARDTGPRSAVYAEPGVVDKAAHEFEDTEKLIATAEKLYGPYAWGRYDLLVLPPAFPVGGSENPNMTFTTPTLLVGDKSLVWVISHELAHSWSGNTVTNSAWRDIWLNEGFTTYVQLRITEAVYGKTEADEEALHFWRSIEKDIATLPVNEQKLAKDPLGVDPDDFSLVAYYKGSLFLHTLEVRFGREAFDPWLRGYFEHFAWQSIDTETMFAYMKKNLIDKYPGKMSEKEAREWIFDPGIPKNAPLPTSPRFDAIDRQRVAFLEGRIQPSAFDAKTWNTQEWMNFLDGLPSATPLDKIQAIDAVWHLTGTPNAEIGERWYAHAVAAGDKAVWAAAGQYMQGIGRASMILPVYRSFVASPEGLTYAEKVYATAKSGYHALARQAVEGVLAEAHHKH